jgi:hypothetical protein
VTASGIVGPLRLSPRWVETTRACAMVAYFGWGCSGEEIAPSPEAARHDPPSTLTTLRRGADAAQTLHGLALDASLGGGSMALLEAHDALAGRPDADPDTRARALWEGGRLAARAGDVAGARARLDACLSLSAATSLNRGACLEARATIDLEADAVRSLPTLWTFDSPAHGLAHPRAWWDQGDIALIPAADGGGLRWTVRVDAERDDRLALAFDLKADIPSAVRIELTSAREPGALRAVFEDIDGRTWSVDARDWQAPADVRARWTLDLDALFPDDGRAPTTLDRTRLHRLYVVDRTARLGVYGAHVWTLHSLAIEG